MGHNLSPATFWIFLILGLVLTYIVVGVLFYPTELKAIIGRFVKSSPSSEDAPADVNSETQPPVEPSTPFGLHEPCPTCGHVRGTQATPLTASPTGVSSQEELPFEVAATIPLVDPDDDPAPLEAGYIETDAIKAVGDSFVRAAAAPKDDPDRFDVATVVAAERGLLGSAYVQRITAKLAEAATSVAAVAGPAVSLA